MKSYAPKLGLTLLFALINLSINAQRVFKGPEAHKQIRYAEILRESQFSELPSYIKFQKAHQIEIDELETWMKSNFKMNANMHFELIRKDTDNLGHAHYRYQQYYLDKPIEDAIWIAHTNNDKIYSLNGLIYNSINPSTSPALNETEALEKAKIHVGATTYKWELPAEEQHLKWEKNDPSATYYPTGELVLISNNYSFTAESYTLAYKFNIYAHQPISRADIYIDAQTGTVIRENEIIHHVDEPGVAHTAYSGEQDIIADSFDGEYRLRDHSRGDGVRTFDLNTGTSYGAAVDFIDDDNDWNNVNPEKDEYATDAHWGAEMTYDYFFDIHGRNSIDNTGFQLNSYVHYGVDFFNAFWDGSRMTYGDGNGGSVTPLTSLDIAGHEVTHGLTTFSAGLIYYAESGALNESFSDIFGTAIERFARPDDHNWLIGEDIGTHFRSMSNPNSKGDPDTYFGDHWAPLGGGDSGGVHTNSGVQNFWFYLLTEGGAGTNDNGDDYAVSALGIDNASAIAFRNLTVYLTSSSQFADARFYAIESAVDLFGACTFEVEQTANAWYAVGVGGVYDPTTIAGFSTLDTFGCSIPHEVHFTNESYNGGTFEWDFGDGTTSTEENPIHTYTEAGTYTVSLTADGGACGTDATTIIDYIIVDPDAECVPVLPPSGTLGTQSACEGTLYDSGGADADYGAGENAQVTIAPLGAASVNLSFPVFDVEAGPGATCNYDYLEIYDGPDIYAPLIDRYCNNNIPTDLTSSGGSITLFFHSDGGVEDPGFQIDWTCNPPDAIPETDFEAHTEITCSGLVYFTDLSTNIPIAWEWDFGDGTTSTEQHPVHTYASEGTYTVMLIATNLVGDNTEIKTDYITVAFPDAPTTVNDTNCIDLTATLTATGEGTLKWYTTPTGGSPFYEGASYTTSPLAVTTTYYVEDDLYDSPEYLGPIDNTIGTGDYYSGDQFLVFNNPTPTFLKSVKVYAGSDGDRTIELRNSEGEILEAKTVFIPSGEQTVYLDLDLPVGTGLQLGTAEGIDADLYRNDTGGTYPYTLTESTEIIGSSTGDARYYYFYNWEIHPYNCASERTPVTAVVETESDITITAPASPLCIDAGSFILSATELGGTWSADCETCIDSETGEFNPEIAGLGTYTVTYAVEGTCSHLNTLSLTIENSDITILPIDDICAQSEAITLEASETGGTWSADCGSCINPATGEFAPSLAGIGTYEITYDVDETCSQFNTATINVVDCLSLDETRPAQVYIYPNPTTGLVYIKTNDLINGTIRITDVLGRTLATMAITQETLTVDMNKFNANGTYFIELYDNDQKPVTIEKIIKQ